MLSPLPDTSQPWWSGVIIDMMIIRMALGLALARAAVVAKQLFGRRS